MKIIRVLWGDKFNPEVPRIRLLKDEVVYVYDLETSWELMVRGFEVRLVNEDLFDGKWNNFGRKLQCLDLALKEFGEVILLDWDCYQLKPFDDEFYNILKEKPIQIPLYIQHKDTKDSILEMLLPQGRKMHEELELLEEGFKKYGWEWEDGIVAPNFGFVYCRDKSFGEKLVNIALKNDLTTVVDEFATLLYVDCTLEEYIEKYLTPVLRGSSNDKFILDNRLHKLGKKFNDYIDTQINIKSYFEHV